MVSGVLLSRGGFDDPDLVKFFAHKKELQQISSSPEMFSSSFYSLFLFLGLNYHLDRF